MGRFKYTVCVVVVFIRRWYGAVVVRVFVGAGCFGQFTLASELMSVRRLHRVTRVRTQVSRLMECDPVRRLSSNCDFSVSRIYSARVSFSSVL